jgi:hypothetical protein
MGVSEMVISSNSKTKKSDLLGSSYLEHTSRSSRQSLLTPCAVQGCLIIVPPPS